MQRAAIHYLKDRIIINSESRAKAGFWLSDHPFFSFGLTATGDEIVKSIKTCLASSRNGLPNPSNWDVFQKTQLGYMGLKSWSEIKDPRTKFCYIDLENKLIKFIPSSHDNEANNAGFFQRESDAVSVKADADTASIYNALELALSKCN